MLLLLLAPTERRLGVVKQQHNQREGPGSEPGNSLSVPTKPHAVFCVPCLRDGSVSSELIA